MRRATLAVLSLVAAGSVQAAGIGVRAGTTGVGADVAWDLAPTLSAPPNCLLRTSYLLSLKITPPVRRNTGPSGWKSIMVFRFDSLSWPSYSTPDEVSTS